MVRGGVKTERGEGERTRNSFSVVGLIQSRFNSFEKRKMTKLRVERKWVWVKEVAETLCCVVFWQAVCVCVCMCVCQGEWTSGGPPPRWTDWLSSGYIISGMLTDWVFFFFGCALVSLRLINSHTNKTTFSWIDGVSDFKHTNK